MWPIAWLDDRENLRLRTRYAQLSGPDVARAYPYAEGRQVTGQDAKGDYTFAPRNATCNLAVLSPGPVPSTIAPVSAAN